MRNKDKKVIKLINVVKKKIKKNELLDGKNEKNVKNK